MDSYRCTQWMFQDFPLPAPQDILDSSGTTPCIVMNNDGVLYHKMSSFSPESMRLQSLHQSERTTVRDTVQHKTWTCLCYIWNINKDGLADSVRRLPNIWQKVINKGDAVLKVHKCCTPVNKAKSEISNCCHYFLSNAYIHVACPQSKFPGAVYRSKTQFNTGTDTASVELLFNIFFSGIESFVIPWDQRLYPCVVEVCRREMEPLCDSSRI